MFTTVMYGFINEVTRQPASAELPLRRSPRTAPVHTAAHRRAKPGRAADNGRAQLAGRYRVLADSFKRAAGFH